MGRKREEQEGKRGGGGGWVFFFKQKTAYEIRNCDWSSDVCSSDLASTRKAMHMVRADSKQVVTVSNAAGNKLHEFRVDRKSVV